ncbi:MAG: hypothetical protein WC773_02715 [Patescibacteria group bacterium]|jgi:hypothetical protein
MNKRLLFAVVGIVVVLGAIAVVLMVFANKKTGTTTPTSSPSAVSSTSPSASSSASASTDSILSADTKLATENSINRFATAKSRISQWPMWKSNATFSGLFISLSATLKLDSANEVYVFDSTDDNANHYTISISQSTGSSLRAIIPKSDYQGSLLAIDTAYWKSSYVDAVQIADQNGGSQFSSSNKVTGVDVNLQRSTPNNYLYWIVTYKTADAGTSLVVKIDANSKTVVKE